MDVPKQRTTAMVPVGHLRPRRHHQSLLSRYHLHPLHKGVAHKDLKRHLSLEMHTILRTRTHRIHRGHSAGTGLHQLMCLPRLKQHHKCRNHKPQSLQLRLLKHLEHLAMTVRPMQRPRNDYIRQDPGMGLLGMRQMLCTIEAILADHKMVRSQQYHHRQMSVMADFQVHISHRLLWRSVDPIYLRRLGQRLHGRSLQHLHACHSHRLSLIASTTQTLHFRGRGLHRHQVRLQVHGIEPSVYRPRSQQHLFRPHQRQTVRLQ